ncbi:MAG: pitrilysin family protein, partial [Ignavibacteria bacterium]|nr:pitrilysin family protein [Ignavibacteria bacterium]
DAFYFQPPIEALELMNTFLPEKDDEVIKPKPIEPMIKTMKLKNGITIHTMENHLIPTVSIVGLFETGIMPEALKGGKPGISSFLSNVMNRGTKNLNYEQLSERLAFVPFSFSTSGSYKSFFFQGNSLIENADEMMKTGFSIVTEPALLDNEIEKLRPRHLIQAKNRMKSTSMKAFYHMYNTIFEGHPVTKYFSNEQSLKSITKNDLIELHKKYFQPKNATLLMVGDMSPQKMKELADKYFGTWKSKAESFRPVKAPAVKELDKKVIKVFTEKDYTECTINIGFAPNNDVDPDEEEIMTVMNYILAGSALTSRMGIELRDKQGLVYGIKSEPWSISDGIGYWKFNTKTAPKNVTKVITGIFGEIKKFFESGITDEELETSKNRQLGLLPFFVETPDDVATRVFELLSDKKPFDFFDKKAERIRKVTKEDVMRIAKKYFTLDKYVIVVDGPIEENSLDKLSEQL